MIQTQPSLRRNSKYLAITLVIVARSIPVAPVLAQGSVLEVVDVEVGGADQSQQEVAGREK